MFYILLREVECAMFYVLLREVEYVYINVLYVWFQDVLEQRRLALTELLVQLMLEKDCRESQLQKRMVSIFDERLTNFKLNNTVTSHEFSLLANSHKVNAKWEQDMHFVWFSMWDGFFSPQVSESHPSRLWWGWDSETSSENCISHGKP